MSGTSRFWCDECQGLGIVECDCGGDICVCLNYNEQPCPRCDGMGGDDWDAMDDDPGM